MGLREDAIRQYREKNDAKEAAQAEEKRERVKRGIAEASKRICKAFALDECPTITVVQNAAEYWPKATFEVDGIEFGYDLGRDNIGVKVVCPKCSQEWRNTVRIEADKEGVRDLTDLGFELCSLERHNCPADRPPYVPPPQAKTVTYRVGSAEHNLLEAIREYVDDAIEQGREI